MAPLDALLIAGGYVAGAVPWGVILGKAFQGRDLRDHGSGGTGSTNALRVLGWRISLLVLVLDFLKGFVPVIMSRALGVGGWSLTAVGIAATVGHCWSLFIGFRGGKGVATGAGAAIALVPWLLLVLPLMVAIVALTRYVSLASIAGCLTACFVMILAAADGRGTWSAVGLVLGVTIIVVVQHRSNVQRLLTGTERRFGESAT